MTTKPRIRAADAVNDIRSGMNDSELMEKYGLSPKGLDSLFRKLVEARALSQDELDQRDAACEDEPGVKPIDGKDMIADIRAGMSDAELMRKYDLSSEGLGFVLQTLTDTKVISVEELYGTKPSQYDTVFVETLREAPRRYMAMEVEVYDSMKPDIKGRLTDATDTGIGMAGIEARVGETKTFIIPAKGFVGVRRIIFQAECRWVREDEDTGELLSGFEITVISPKCSTDLNKLVAAASFPG